MMRTRIAAVLAAIACLSPLPAVAQNSFNDAPGVAAPAPVAAPAAAPAPPPVAASEVPRRAAPANAAPSAEQQDFGVPARRELHAGAMHGPTPTSIPGGQVITTPALLARRGRGSDPLVFDVLGGPERLPNAISAVPAHQPGTFDDATQREFGAFLHRVTQGRKDAPLVFYCQSVQCWMSYNAALRAIRLGYTQVLWYRGGLEAWKAAGQPVQSGQAAR